MKINRPFYVELPRFKFFELATQRDIAHSVVDET